MKPTELNPDYVRFQNDKKKKRLTKRHLAQKIAQERKCLLNYIEWKRRDEKRIQELTEKIAKMEKEYEAME